MFRVSFIQAGGLLFLLNCGLIPVGGFGPVACEGFLIGGIYVCVLVDGAGDSISLEGSVCLVVNFEVSMGLVLRKSSLR